MFDMSNTADYDNQFPFFQMQRTYQFGSYRLADDNESPSEDNSPPDERDQDNDTRVAWINAGIQVQCKPKPTVIHKNDS